MTTDAKTETVLLPCPWCHQPPQTVGIFVVCKNESCPSSQLIEKSKWNRRATPAGPDQIALMRNEILIYTREIENLKAERNKAAMLERSKYLPKIGRLSDALEQIRDNANDDSRLNGLELSNIAAEALKGTT